MWTSNEILQLTFATVNFATSEITWNFGEFTPKRQNALNLALQSKIVNPDFLNKVC